MAVGQPPSRSLTTVPGQTQCVALPETPLPIMGLNGRSHDWLQMMDALKFRPVRGTPTSDRPLDPKHSGRSGQTRSFGSLARSSARATRWR